MTLLSNKLDLVSIHVPKTGGSSFQLTLSKVYGESFKRLDFAITDSEVPAMVAKNNTSDNELSQYGKARTLPDDVRCVHGHFTYLDARKAFGLENNTPVVSWIRHPVKRVISNYAYLSEKLAEKVQFPNGGEQILSRLKRSLLEFANLERDRSMYRTYLAGGDLSKFTFIGIVEKYDSEIKRLAGIFGWGDLDQFHVNSSKGDAMEISKKDVRKLHDLYAEEIKIYERACQISVKPSLH